MIDEFCDWIDTLPEWVYTAGLIALAVTMGYVFMGVFE